MDSYLNRPDTRPRRNKWNALGLWALYRREVMRFFKMYAQTFVAPVVTALLFLSIFSLAFDGDGRSIGDIDFAVFLMPGLVLMAMMTSCFANASFSIMFEKAIQTLVDTLMPPMSPLELVTGYVLASTTRGILVGIAVGGTMSFFIDIHIHSLFFILYHGVATALLMSLLGLLTSIWADKIDYVASINNFVILPLTFLSGTFYSAQNLPPLAQTVARFNPFFYMIDGFRYGFIGHADATLSTGLIVVGTLIVGLWLLAMHLFRIGYKLKS